MFLCVLSVSVFLGLFDTYVSVSFGAGKTFIGFGKLGRILVCSGGGQFFFSKSESSRIFQLGMFCTFCFTYLKK